MNGYGQVFTYHAGYSIAIRLVREEVLVMAGLSAHSTATQGCLSCVRTVARNEPTYFHELLVVMIVVLTSRAPAPENVHDFRVYLLCAAHRGPSALFPRHATPGLSRPISRAAHTVLSSLYCCGCSRPSLKLNRCRQGLDLMIGSKVSKSDFRLLPQKTKM